MTDQANTGPKPDALEQHPFAYRWERRFHDIRVLMRGEGSSIFSAIGEGAYWIVHDEGTLADFLPEDDPLRSQLISLKRYDSRRSWAQARAAIVDRVRTQFDKPITSVPEGRNHRFHD
jgi:hypothetical protein